MNVERKEQREKLIDLIVNAKRADSETGSFTEFLADFLLGHGVFVPDDDYDLDRLWELVQADRDGRCIILRFKPGMFVYRVWPRCDRRKFPFMTSYYLDCKEACIEAQLWNDVYESEEAAKAALNKLKEAEME